MLKTNLPTNKQVSRMADVINATLRQEFDDLLETKTDEAQVDLDTRYNDHKDVIESIKNNELKVALVSKIGDAYIAVQEATDNKCVPFEYCTVTIERDDDYNESACSWDQRDYVKNPELYLKSRTKSSEQNVLNIKKRLANKDAGIDNTWTKKSLMTEEVEARVAFMEISDFDTMVKEILKVVKPIDFLNA